MAERPDPGPVESGPLFGTLSNGDIRIRPIRPDDADGLVQFHQHLSPRTIYRRYLSNHPTLSDTEVEHFTHVDNEARLALVAVCDGQLVAVGRYERLPDTTRAEVAFVVADEFQHRGIGTSLLYRLAEAALGHGITTFMAETLSDNRDMLDVFLHSGFAVTTSRADGTVEVSFPIEPDEHYLFVREQRRESARPATGAAPC